MADVLLQLRDEATFTDNGKAIVDPGKLERMATMVQAIAGSLGITSKPEVVAVDADDAESATETMEEVSDAE
eukprot:13673157-Alexandrium_andersonii.AAC.1